MNRERAKELLPIIQAFVDGKTIQYLDIDGSWYDLDEPNWEYSVNNKVRYRIKPEPREFWIQIQKSYDGNEKITGSGWIDKGDPTPEATGKMSTIIKVREVIE